jgi:hypothetical protein
VPVVVLPVLLGAACTIVVLTVLSLLCYREFGRATGLFRDKLMSLLVVVGILALAFAVADRWYALFVALTPMSIVVIAAVATSLDRPKGYIQRVALAIFGFILFGTCLCPVVPCHLSGAFEAFPPEARWPRPRRIRLRIGQSLLFDSVDNRRDGWEHITHHARESVRLLGDAPR